MIAQVRIHTRNSPINPWVSLVNKTLAPLLAGHVTAARLLKV